MLSERRLRMDRTKTIVRTSFIGIAVNLVLVAFKALIGLAANSIAVILDAVNNLSDALSSVITIVGTKLASRKPDKKHPFGHGRIEYLTSIAVALIIIVAGATSMKESVEKILNPEAADYRWYSLVIIAVAVGAKIFIGRYFKKVGKKVGSDALVNSGADALFDAILSTATLVCAMISLIWGLSLEGWVGGLISIFILKAGGEMILETGSSIIGKRVDNELAEKIRETVTAHPEVHGAYDLTIHNYGPTQSLGTVHIEVDDTMTARQIHRLSRAITAEVYMKFGIIMSVGIYAANTSTPEIAALRASVEAAVKARPEILQMHGFYVEEDAKCVMFDLIVDFAADASAVRDSIIAELSSKHPDYRFDVILDTDFSEPD